MAIFGLFKPVEPQEETYDDFGSNQLIDSAGTVRTTPLILGFKKLSANDIQKKRQALAKRKEQQKNFQEMLKIGIEWEKLDVVATVELAKYLATVRGYQVEKRLARQAIAVAQQQGRLAMTRADLALEDVTKKVDQEIAKLKADRAAVANKYGLSNR